MDGSHGYAPSVGVALGCERSSGSSVRPPVMFMAARPLRRKSASRCFFAAAAMAGSSIFGGRFDGGGKAGALGLNPGKIIESSQDSDKVGMASGRKSVCKAAP